MQYAVTELTGAGLNCLTCCALPVPKSFLHATPSLSSVMCLAAPHHDLANHGLLEFADAPAQPRHVEVRCRAVVALRTVQTRCFSVTTR